MEKRALILVLLALFLIVLPKVFAEDYIISNSEDWRDVYSITHYANLKGIPSDFLVSSLHGSIILSSVSKSSQIQIISSSKKPFVIGYQDLARGQGYENTSEVSYANPNLELLAQLNDINNFIVVGNTYGYNAIAVAPYAVLTKSWVIFADRSNIGEIDSVLSARSVNKVMIYGYVDREVKTTLAKYNPETINTGDRFKDDIEIVKKYLEVKKMNQVVLTNGEFIEKEVMSGVEPLLFTGKENVPDSIAEYIKSSDLQVGVLVGSDLIGAATNIRRTTGINVIVKFARGARVPAGGVSPVEGLDLFYLPVPTLNLSISSLKYNKATSQLELTYKSNANVPMYFRGTLTYESAAGDKSRVGDALPVFIAPNEFKTVTYSDLKLPDNPAPIDLLTLFGETPSSLEKVLQAKLDVEVVNVLDRCKVGPVSAVYSKTKKAVYITVSNKEEADCYTTVELTDLSVNGGKVSLSSEGAVKVNSGKKKSIEIKQELTDSDLADNPTVDATVFSGEKEQSLVNAVERKDLPLGIETISIYTIGLIILIIIVILLIIFLLLRRRKNEDDW